MSLVMPQLCPLVRRWHAMTRAKRDFRDHRKRANGRWQAHYMGPTRQLPSSSVDVRGQSRCRGLLAAERRLMQNDGGRRASRVGRRSCGRRRCSGRMPRRGSSRYRPRTRRCIGDSCWIVHPARLRGVPSGYHPQVVRTWHSGLDSSRPTQRAHTYSLLRSILSTAVTDEILASNPVGARRWFGQARPVDRAGHPCRLEVLLEKDPCAVSRPGAHRRAGGPQVR